MSAVARESTTPLSSQDCGEPSHCAAPSHQPILSTNGSGLSQQRWTGRRKETVNNHKPVHKPPCTPRQCSSGYAQPTQYPGRLILPKHGDTSRAFAPSGGPTGSGPARTLASYSRPVNSKFFNELRVLGLPVVEWHGMRRPNR